MESTALVNSSQKSSGNEEIKRQTTGKVEDYSTTVTRLPNKLNVINNQGGSSRSGKDSAKSSQASQSRERRPRPAQLVIKSSSNMKNQAAFSKVLKIEQQTASNHQQPVTATQVSTTKTFVSGKQKPRRSKLVVKDQDAADTAMKTRHKSAAFKQKGADGGTSSDQQMSASIIHALKDNIEMGKKNSQRQSNQDSRTNSVAAPHSNPKDNVAGGGQQLTSNTVNNDQNRRKRLSEKNQRGSKHETGKAATVSTTPKMNSCQRPRVDKSKKGSSISANRRLSVNSNRSKKSAKSCASMHSENQNHEYDFNKQNFAVCCKDAPKCMNSNNDDANDNVSAQQTEQNGEYGHPASDIQEHQKQAIDMEIKALPYGKLSSQKTRANKHANLQSKSSSNQQRRKDSNLKEKKNSTIQGEYNEGKKAVLKNQNSQEDIISKQLADQKSISIQNLDEEAVQIQLLKQTQQIIDQKLINQLPAQAVTYDDTLLVAPMSALLPPPHPLLPKTLKVQEKPPESSIKGIVFRKLKEFKQFPEQPNDQLAELTGPIKLEKPMVESPSPLRERSAGLGSVQISIEQSRLIRNIVYLRDVSMLETLGKGIDELTQRDVFQHENFLDVKQLIRERDISERMTDQLENAIQRAKRQKQAEKNAAQPNILTSGGTLDLRNGCYKLLGPQDKTLQFESRFESGNLFLATKVSEQEYDLLMQNDTNTLGHTQWFYFKVSNTRAGHPVKFNIMNYNKPDSMFNYGMKVSVYSDRKADAGQVGWHRACSDISYFKNQVRKDFNFTKYYHTLTFTYEFEHDYDTVFFAYCYPYTYTDLSTDIMQLERDRRRASFIQRTTLCKTLGGVNCEVLTITQQSAKKPQEPSAKGLLKAATNEVQKQGVVISARVHPGETVGSWMMRGILFFLTDPDNKEAKVLRKNFIFKIIPMLNPDGVINGNYRCSLAGCDLNRRWKFPSKQLQPTVYNTKRLIKKVHAERTCALYCDLHGHSRKPNVFMYGCDKKGAPEDTRIFPLLLSKISPLFDFGASRFGVQKSKESTARVAIFKELKTCPLVYTMESTFSGLDKGPYAGLHISTEMLQSMGVDLCRALLIQFNLEVPQELKSMPTVKTMKTRGATSKIFSAEPLYDGETLVINEHALSIKQTLIAELRANKELLRAGNGDSSSGSDSQPSEDNLEATELVKNLPAVDKPLSMALKQEQATRKEVAKTRRQERSSSPLKGGSEQRWRFTTTSSIKSSYGDSTDPTNGEKSTKKGGRQNAIKLSEIKESHFEDQSNASPLKVVRDPINRQPLKNQRAKMVDVDTQTDRSYFLMKNKAMNRNARQSQGQREGTVQLRIANIALHETAFSTGSRTGLKNAGNNQNNSSEVNFQGPTVGDFNAMFTPSGIQLQATVVNVTTTAAGAQRANFISNEQKQQYIVNNNQFHQYVNNEQGTTHKNAAADSRNNNYIGHAGPGISAPDNAVESAGPTTISQQATDRQHQIARYGSVQQPRLKQLQEFQMLSRAAQYHTSQTNKSQVSSNAPPKSEQTNQNVAPADISNASNHHQGHNNHEASRSQDASSTNGGHRQEQHLQQDMALVNIGRDRSQTKPQDAVIINNNAMISYNDYLQPSLLPPNVVMMTQNSVITNSQGNNHNNLQQQQRRSQTGSGSVPNQQQQQKTPQNNGSFGMPTQATIQHFARSSIQNQQDNNNKKKQKNQANTSPLIAFLENQIQFEKHKLEKNNNNNNNGLNINGGNTTGLATQHKNRVVVNKSVLNEKQIRNDSRGNFVQYAINGDSSGHNRTGGLQMLNQDLYDDIKLNRQGGGFQHVQQERNTEVKQIMNKLLPQLRGGSEQTAAVPLPPSALARLPGANGVQTHLNLTKIQSQAKDNKPFNNEGDQKANSSQIALNTYLNQAALGRDDFSKPSGVKTSKQLNSSKPLKGPTLLSGANAANTNQNNATSNHTGANNKKFPAGLRNQVVQQNKSNLYNKIYNQQKQANDLYINQRNRPDIQRSTTAEAEISKANAHYQNNNLKQQNATSSQVKFAMMGNNNQSHNFTIATNGAQQNNDVSPKINNANYVYHNQNLSMLQEMRERQNISELQVYKNRPVGDQANMMAQKHLNDDILPHLQKYGSQNEILSNTLNPSNYHTNPRGSTSQNTSVPKPPDKTHLRHSSMTEQSRQQQWNRAANNNNNNNKAANSSISHIQAGSGDFDFVTNKSPKQNFITKHPSYSSNNTPTLKRTQLIKAHAEGRPNNNPASIQNVSRKANNFNSISLSPTQQKNQKTNNYQQKHHSTTGVMENDYMQVPRQQNFAFVPTGKMMSQKKSVSQQSSQGNTAAQGAFSASQASRPLHIIPNSGLTALQQKLTYSVDQSPPGTSHHNKQLKIGGGSGSMHLPAGDGWVVGAPGRSEARAVSQTGNYLATGPIDFGVLQTRQLVNNNLSSLTPMTKSGYQTQQSLQQTSSWAKLDGVNSQPPPAWFLDKK